MNNFFARHPVSALHTVLVPLPVGMRPSSKITNGLHGTLFVPYKKKEVFHTLLARNCMNTDNTRLL